ncbi:MAG: hypothetical protein R3C26_19705 [Calditrichia bacterium]
MHNLPRADTALKRYANGAAFYSIAEMADPAGDGRVSCKFTCHQIKDVGLGPHSSFSGHYVIENDRIIYVPVSQYAGHAGCKRR